MDTETLRVMIRALHHEAHDVLDATGHLPGNIMAALHALIKEFDAKGGQPGDACSRCRL